MSAAGNDFGDEIAERFRVADDVQGSREARLRWRGSATEASWLARDSADKAADTKERQQHPTKRKLTIVPLLMMLLWFAALGVLLVGIANTAPHQNPYRGACALMLKAPAEFAADEWLFEQCENELTWDHERN